MSVLNGEPEKISWKIGIPLVLIILSLPIYAWINPLEGFYYTSHPNFDLALKIIITIVSPIGSLMVLAWTKFKKDKNV